MSETLRPSSEAPKDGAYIVIQDGRTVYWRGTEWRCVTGAAFPGAVILESEITGWREVPSTPASHPASGGGPPPQS